METSITTFIENGIFQFRQFTDHLKNFDNKIYRNRPYLVKIVYPQYRRYTAEID